MIVDDGGVDGVSVWIVDPRYELLHRLGRGSYGEVYAAVDRLTGARVAIKRIANALVEPRDVRCCYREVHILDHLYGTEGIIQLVDVFIPVVPFQPRHPDIYLVFERMNIDLYQMMGTRQKFTEQHIQMIFWQVLQGLGAMHSMGYIHRDIKPSNILLDEYQIAKICDFGLARAVGHPPKDDADPSPTTTEDASRHQKTAHVSTRWYRAPEVIFLDDYGYAADVWSAGCVLAELLAFATCNAPTCPTKFALFPGDTCTPFTRVDNHREATDEQLYKILSIVGTPSETYKARLIPPARQYLNSFPVMDRTPLAKLYPHASIEVIDLLERMLAFDPTERITVRDALQHAFFREMREVVPPTQSPPSCMAKDLFVEDTDVLVDDLHRDFARRAISDNN